MAHSPTITTGAIRKLPTAQAATSQSSAASAPAPSQPSASGTATTSPPSTADEDNLKGEFVKKLIKNFDVMVVNFVDKATRDAILQQTEFTDEKEFSRVKLAIENRILDLLVKESHLTTVPPVSFFREVVGILSNRYPYMFLEDPTVTVQGQRIRQFTGKGTGGLFGVKSLPKSLQQKFSRMLESKLGVVKKKKRDLPDENSQVKVPKRKKRVYGITSDKFNAEKTEDLDTFLGEVENVASTEEREAIFAHHRKDLQHKLVNSKNLFTAVPGFFDSLSHAENHFVWLTGKDIAKNIENDLSRQFKIVQCVVKEMCTTKEFRLNLEIAKLKGTEENGSIIPEFICLLRQLNVEWHQTAGGLFRFPADPDDNSPHIFCPDGVGTVKFDVHVESRKAYVDLNFSEALRAFFSVCFIWNYHYPEAGEAVAILLQRKLAGFNAEGKNTCFLDCFLASRIQIY
jgi:hypothetical protein